MDQPPRALPSPVEDLGLVPSTHMAAHNCLGLQFPGIRRPLLASADTKHTWCPGKAPIHTELN